MATSGSYDWTMTCDNIIRRGLRLAGLLRTGETPVPSLKSDALATLNSILQELHMKGMGLWSLSEATDTLAEAATHTISDATILGVAGVAFIRDGSTDTPVEIIDRHEWADITDKTSTGLPTRMWVETKVASLVLHFDLIPDKATYDLHYFQIKRLSDFDAYTNTGDFPDRWIETVAVGLGATLALENPEMDVDRIDRLTLQAKRKLREVKRDIREKPTRTIVEPSYEV